jgi:hypothetical protein
MSTTRPAKPANPNLYWTGNETKGLLARGFVNDDVPVAYTVTPVNVLGGESRFEANIITDRNFDSDLSVKRLTARYGASLYTYDAKGRRRTLGPVPTAAEAKALVEADYARR